MSELLAPLAPHLRELRWSIYELDHWVSREPTDQDAFLNQIEASEAGLEISFDELARFAESAVQIVDGLFLGVEQAGQFPLRGADDAALIAGVDVLLSAFDSTFWIVGGPRPLLQAVERAFTTEDDAGPLRT